MSAMSESRGRRPRRRFTDEFKQQAVRLVLDEGKSVTAVARELDLTPSGLGAWVKQAPADRTKGRTWKCGSRPSLSIIWIVATPATLDTGLEPSSECAAPVVRSTARRSR